MAPFPRVTRREVEEDDNEGEEEVRKRLHIPGVLFTWLSHPLAAESCGPLELFSSADTSEIILEPS